MQRSCLFLKALCASWFQQSCPLIPPHPYWQQSCCCPCSPRTGTVAAQALMLHVGVLQQPHTGKMNLRVCPLLMSLFVPVFSFTCCREWGGVFRWEFRILEAAVIEGKLQNIKSMVNLALFFLNQVSNGMMFSRLVLSLSSPDHKVSETGPVPWTLCSPQWGPCKVNFGIEYNLGFCCVLGMVWVFYLFLMRVHP